MGTKRRAGIVGVLCGTCLVFAVMLGRTGIARAGDGEVPPPEVEGSWQEEHVRFQPVERTPYKRDDGAAKGAAAAHQPSASTKRSILPEEPLKETVAGVVARQALPWVAGILARRRSGHGGVQLLGPTPAFVSSDGAFHNASPDFRGSSRQWPAVGPRQARWEPCADGDAAPGDFCRSPDRSPDGAAQAAGGVATTRGQSPCATHQSTTDRTLGLAPPPPRQHFGNQAGGGRIAAGQHRRGDELHHIGAYQPGRRFRRQNAYHVHRLGPRKAVRQRCARAGNDRGVQAVHVDGQIDLALQPRRTSSISPHTRARRCA